LENYNHELRTLKFDISFYSEDLARDLQNQISKLSNGKLDTIINRVCDEELNDKNSFLQIDTLEIDLGVIPYAEVNQLLPAKLYQAFGQSIRRRISQRYKPGYSDEQPVSQISGDGRSEDLLFAFLQTGTLPWWTDSNSWSQLESTFLRLLKDRPRETVTKIYAAGNFQNMIQRIIYQFSETLLTALTEALHPLHAKPLIKQVSVFAKSAALSRLGIRFDKNRQWKMIFAFLDPSVSRPVRNERSMTEFILDRLAAEDNFNRVILLDRLEIDFPGQDSPKILLDFGPLISELFELKQHYQQSYEDIIAFINQYRSNWHNLDAFVRDFFTHLQKRPLPDQIAAGIVDLALQKTGFYPDNSTAKPGWVEQELRQDREEKKPVEPKQRDRDLSPGNKEVYYIENAGIVLINPFLSTFYERIGLMKRGEFIDKQAANRAIHLLQFLADGKESHSENLLLLNKILCGVAIDEPIEKEITMSETEKETALDLLNAALSSWPQLKNSSINTLRNEFLLRKGKLSFYDGEWVVRIEHNGRSDYLLNTVPWSFNMIKNSWMYEILRVEWI
jgi:hypothetical protein